MLRSRSLSLGRLSGTIYDFEQVGDELATHTHDENNVHISIVARGKLHAFGDGWEREVSAGAVLDWEPGVYHGFRALEPNTRLVNIIKA